MSGLEEKQNEEEILEQVKACVQKLEKELRELATSNQVLDSESKIKAKVIASIFKEFNIASDYNNIGITCIVRESEENDEYIKGPEYRIYEVVAGRPNGDRELSYDDEFSKILTEMNNGETYITQCDGSDKKIKRELIVKADSSKQLELVLENSIAKIRHESKGKYSTEDEQKISNLAYFLRLLGSNSPYAKIDCYYIIKDKRTSKYELVQLVGGALDNDITKLTINSVVGIELSKFSSTVPVGTKGITYVGPSIEQFLQRIIANNKRGLTVDEREVTEVLAGHLRFEESKSPLANIGCWFVIEDTRRTVPFRFSMTKLVAGYSMRRYRNEREAAISSLNGVALVEAAKSFDNNGSMIYGYKRIIAITDTEEAANKIIENAQKVGPSKVIGTRNLSSKPKC